MKKWPYWLKGGLLGIPLSLVIIPISYFSTIALGASEDAVPWFLAPEFYGVLLGLGMSGSPPSPEEVIGSLTFATLIFVIRIFIIGAILGAIYGAFARRNKRHFFLIGLAIVYIAALGLLVYRTQNVLSVYHSARSAEDCKNSTNKFVENFDENRCYQELAAQTQDVHICDNIKIVSPAAEKIEDFRAFCYEEVAYAKKDPSICGLITESQRQDSCYSRFSLCDKVNSVEGKDFCYTHRASFEHDYGACNLVTIQNRDKCYTEAAWESKDFSLCAAVQNSTKKQQCYDSQVYYEATKVKKDPLLCDQIQEQRRKEDCHAYLNKILNGKTA